MKFSSLGKQLVGGWSTERGASEGDVPYRLAEHSRDILSLDGVIKAVRI